MKKIIPNGGAQTRDRQQVILPYSSTALPSPPLPTRPGSPIPSYSHSEGLLINHARRCTFFGQLLVIAVD